MVPSVFRCIDCEASSATIFTDLNMRMRYKPYCFFSNILSINNVNSTGPNRASIDRALNLYCRPLYCSRSGLCGRSLDLLITSSSCNPYTGKIIIQIINLFRVPSCSCWFRRRFIRHLILDRLWPGSLHKPHLRWRGSVASKPEGTRFVLRVPLSVAILVTFEVSFFVS